MSRAFPLLPLFALLATSCSSNSKKEALTVPAGEKATVGPLVYNVIETQVLTKLGDDPASVRTPTNRFYLLRVAVSNSSNEDLAIPGLTLVDDSNQEYPEMADGTGVPNWLGIVRRVAAAQTEEGDIAFDAPAQHYRLRLTDETDDRQLFIDVPLTYVPEQLNDVPAAPAPETPPVIPDKKR